jgi:hypothetical protein
LKAAPGGAAFGIEQVLKCRCGSTIQRYGAVRILPDLSKEIKQLKPGRVQSSRVVFASMVKLLFTFAPSSAINPMKESTMSKLKRMSDRVKHNKPPLPRGRPVDITAIGKILFPNTSPEDQAATDLGAFALLEEFERELRR